jgi:hypothetical protein
VLRTLLVETEQKPSFLMDRFHMQFEVISMTLTHQKVILKETLFGHSCAGAFIIKINACNFESYVQYSILKLRYTYQFQDGQHVMRMFPWVY